MSPFFREQTLLTKAIWIALVADATLAIVELRFSLAFIALVTLALSMAPALVAKWAAIEVPKGFVLAVVVFIAGTVFLGEVYDFYNKLWWWDMMMHGGSAVGFGLIGFVLVFMMFQGDRFAAPPSAIAVFAFCFAVAIGAIWEIFEFTMDQLFGMNMQKSGLMDTMGDLIVDCIGAMIGAGAGYAYLRGQQLGGMTGVIEDFVRRNPRFFRKWRR
ncbi:hypothetical protein [Pseudooceanicola onchidii]|uniref:hypothetical protein n=1 Tax=Pseudooceanicola onchidii TaxID=2562279 RepID=UPI0010AB1AF4|nr:hypothetical protein [Pseudooceanicola onchidii]